MARMTAIAIGCVAVAAAGCASTDEEQALATYQDDIARATASIDEAEAGGAFEFGSAELNRAREKLGMAEEAAAEDEPARAARLAREAELDADLASAITDTAAMQAAVDEIQATIETLRQETQRGVPSASEQGAPSSASSPGGVQQGDAG